MVKKSAVLTSLENASYIRHMALRNLCGVRNISSCSYQLLLAVAVTVLLVSAVIDKAPGANQLVSWGHYSLHCQTSRHASVAPNTVKVRGQFAKDLMPRAKSGFQAFADSVNSYESGILLGSAFYNRCSKHCIYQCLTWTSDSYRGNYAFVEEDAAKRQHHCKRESKSTPHRGTFLYSNPVGWVRKWYGMVTILCRRKKQIHWHLEVSLPSPIATSLAGLYDLF